MKHTNVEYAKAKMNRKICIYMYIVYMCEKIWRISGQHKGCSKKA